MKIRIKGNSVRIRLTKSEVKKFGKEGYIEETTPFVKNTLLYALQQSDRYNDLHADYNDNKITVFVPIIMAHEWVSTDIVGYDNTMKISDNGSLYILLEKDFKCTDPSVTEDQSDNYEHPNKTC